MLNSFRTHEQNKRTYLINKAVTATSGDVLRFTAEEAARVRTVVEGFSFTAALAAKRQRASQDSAVYTATLDVAALKAGQAARLEDARREAVALAKGLVPWHLDPDSVEEDPYR